MSFYCQYFGFGGSRLVWSFVVLFVLPNHLNHWVANSCVLLAFVDQITCLCLRWKTNKLLAKMVLPRVSFHTSSLEVLSGKFKRSQGSKWSEYRDWQEKQQTVNAATQLLQSPELSEETEVHKKLSAEKVEERKEKNLHNVWRDSFSSAHPRRWRQGPSGAASSLNRWDFCNNTREATEGAGHHHENALEGETRCQELGASIGWRCQAALALLLGSLWNIATQ